jgi:hypothetical protein
MKPWCIFVQPVAVLITFYLHTVSLSLPTCCIRDIIVFATDQDTCFLVDERLSETLIYSQDCVQLQDLLSNTCCGDETDTGNPSPTASPPGGDFPPCSICFDGSTPRNRYVMLVFFPVGGRLNDFL